MTNVTAGDVSTRGLADLLTRRPATALTRRPMMSDDDHSYDVLVCGGGPSGIGAAVAAARNGADTLLVERYGFLGGMATAGLVNPFMPYFAGDEQIIEGVFQEIIDRLAAKGGCGGQERCRAFDPEILKIVADEICLESGVKLLLHAFLSGARLGGRGSSRAGSAGASPSRLDSVQVTCKPREREIKARVYVDATGDADLAHLAGVPCEKGRGSDGLTQPMTLNFRIGGVELDRIPSREEVTKLYLAARDEGRIDCPRNDMLYFTTTRDGEVHFNTTRVIHSDGTSAEDLTRAEIESRRQVAQIAGFLRQDVAGFERAYVQMTGTQIGVRETRRIVGEYVLTADDVLGARKFEDCIARGSYPVDIHDPDGGGTVLKHLQPGESYDIPYRCLVPLAVDNLLVAGRPISSTHEAHSSLRVMPIACAVGQAAGTAAALCVRDNVTPRALDTGLLQRTLVAQGANLGSK